VRAHRQQTPRRGTESAFRAGSERQGEAENSVRASNPRTLRETAKRGAGADPIAAAATEDRAASPAGSAKSPSQQANADSGAVPEAIRRQFVQVGRKYYFADGTRAFTDRGRSLTTPSENTEVIKSLVTIAQARGWSEIAVRGTERFRREAWFSARLAGLEVRGYRPSAFEEGRLIRTLARQSEGPASVDDAAEGTAVEGVRDRNRIASPSREEPRQKRGVLLTGKLVEHGRAPYHHDPHERMSYFVKIETSRGDRVIWGIDLERAFRESLTQPQVADAIGLRAVRQEQVKVRAAKRDPEGQVIGERELTTHRNRWIVEKQTFFKARAAAAETLRNPTISPKQAVRQHPELVGTYLQVHAAEIASRRFRDPEDQRTFVERVRSSLAASIARGEPVPPVRLRERSTKRVERRSPKPRDRETAQVRG
jgi:putative DNA primase/helicase